MFIFYPYVHPSIHFPSFYPYVHHLFICPSSIQVSNVHSSLYIIHVHVADPSVVVMGNLAFGVFDGSMEVDDDIYYIEPSNRFVSIHLPVHVHVTCTYMYM